MLTLACHPVAAQSAAEKSPADLPLVRPVPPRNILLVYEQTDDRKLKELETAQSICKSLKIPHDSIAQFDIKRKDYSPYDLIVTGTNAMDCYEASPESRKPEAFKPLEEFVNSGGHLIVFGSWQGRNCENLQRFGLHTAGGEPRSYASVASRTAALFAGNERHVPEGNYLHQICTFRFTRPSVPMLEESPGGNPVLATVSYGRGRFTFTSVSPSYGPQPAYWLIDAVLPWAIRGGPTSLLVSSRSPISHDGLASQRLPVPGQEQLSAAEKEIRERFPRELTAKTVTKRDAETLRGAANMEADPSLKYVLLRLTADLYADTGSVQEAAETIKTLTSRYAADDGQLLLPVLTRAEAAGRDPETGIAIFNLASSVADSSLKQLRFDDAIAALSVARRAVNGSRTRRLQSVAQVEQRRVEKLAEEWKSLQPAADRLAASTATAEDQEALGRFDIFQLNDWQRGLPLLAEGQDPLLRDAAALEQQHAGASTEYVRIGEAWEKAAAALPPGNQELIYARAALWFGRAASVQAGPEKAALTRHQEEIPTAFHQLRLSIGAFRGTIRLEIAPDRVVCFADRDGQLPATGKIGDADWDIATRPEFETRGVFRVIPPEIALQTARLGPLRSKVSAKILEAAPEKIVLQLQNDKPTSGDSNITIRFGK
ncbi:hypothetical protein [Planctellipticum variicoloris]|uniref:hypothetical protein n=1 Tax=Planctellipticum variicoloris TaxID=3064265 RepID=UPI003013A16F|nr:hypothetical protein SH412_002511 [Planctomycetaceae bacterium SH412]